MGDAHNYPGYEHDPPHIQNIVDELLGERMIRPLRNDPQPEQLTQAMEWPDWRWAQFEEEHAALYARQLQEWEDMIRKARKQAYNLASGNNMEHMLRETNMLLGNPVVDLTNDTEDDPPDKHYQMLLGRPQHDFADEIRKRRRVRTNLEGVYAQGQQLGYVDLSREQTSQEEEAADFQRQQEEERFDYELYQQHPIWDAIAAVPEVAELVIRTSPPGYFSQKAVESASSAVKDPIQEIRHRVERFYEFHRIPADIKERGPKLRPQKMLGTNKTFYRLCDAQQWLKRTGDYILDYKTARDKVEFQRKWDNIITNSAASRLSYEAIRDKVAGQNHFKAQTLRLITWMKKKYAEYSNTPGQHKPIREFKQHMLGRAGLYFFALKDYDTASRLWQMREEIGFYSGWRTEDQNILFQWAAFSRAEYNLELELWIAQTIETIREHNWQWYCFGKHISISEWKHIPMHNGRTFSNIQQVTRDIADYLTSLGFDADNFTVSMALNDENLDIDNILAGKRKRHPDDKDDEPAVN